MSIIYEQTPNGLYATGQRTVSTFPSGLIRVDQTFTCKSSAAATHRATLAVGANFPGDSYPAMDGLKIFPDPQEKRRDDGFTEFTVSGYGRVKDTATIKKKPKTFALAPGGFWGFSVFEIDGSICIPSNSSICYSDLNLPSSYSDPFSPFFKDDGNHSVSITFESQRYVIRVKNDGSSYSVRTRLGNFLDYGDPTGAGKFWLGDQELEYVTETQFGSFKEIVFKASSFASPYWYY